PVPARGPCGGAAAAPAAAGAGGAPANCELVDCPLFLHRPVKDGFWLRRNQGMTCLTHLEVFRMPWFKVTFMVKAESAEALDAELDEGKIGEALPGQWAYLVMIEEKATIPEAVRNTWKRLRGPG
ncbi:MAG: hypothetical protein ABI717_02710, partial [Actinomycetota bacterium]